MSRFAILLGVLLISLSAFGAKNKFELAIDLTVGTSETESKKLTVIEGQRRTIVNQKNFLDLVSIKHDLEIENGIEMKFQFGEILENGQKKILSTPQIVAVENEPAQITVASDESEVFSLSVKATPVTEVK